MRVNARDYDVVAAGALITIATVVAQFIADPATAISLLLVVVAAALALIGEERLEGWWREYNRAPERAPELRRKERVEVMCKLTPPSRSRREPQLAPARVVRRNERVFVSRTA